MSEIENFARYIKTIKKSNQHGDMRKQIFLNNICTNFDKFYKSYKKRYSNSKIYYTLREELNFYKNTIPNKVLQQINSYNLSDQNKLQGLYQIVNLYIKDIHYMCINRFNKPRSSSIKRKTSSKSGTLIKRR